MRRFTLWAMVLLVMGLFAAPGQAFFDGQGALATIDGQEFNVPLQFDVETGLITFAAGGMTANESGGSFTLSGSADLGQIGVDPSIAFGLAVVDLGAPSTFSFAFSTPIVPTGSPNTVAASLGGTLTDFTGDGVSLTPVSGLVMASSVSFPITSMGVDVGPAASFSSAAAGSMYPYGPYSAGPQLGPGPGPWTFLTTSATFTLSGGGDSATLTGLASILPGEPDGVIPEPATACLLALGLAGVVARKRRQCARAAQPFAVRPSRRGEVCSAPVRADE